MIVYRMMGIEELRLYLAGDMENIGKVFLNPEKLSNNNKYEKDQKYVHVFKNLKDLEFVQFERDFEYLATFDIPLVVLSASKGKGFYKNLKNGKLQYKNVREFAINSKLMKAEYFLGYEEINIYEPDIKEYAKMLKKGKLITSDKEYVMYK